jgi:glutathione S-transferase
MAADPLDSLRLTLMQEVLPVGMAVVERVRRGGPREVVEAFTSTADPLAKLRQEGDSAARAVRESLDQIQPGLGNPVVKVEVRDMPTDAAVTTTAPVATAADREALRQTLTRISEHLALLERRLEAKAG